jgi:hypothetical protein
VYVCVKICCLLVWLFVMLKSWSQRRNQMFQTTWRLMVSTWVRTKASLTQPLDHNAPICMIVSSRTWFGWLLHYYLCYSLIVVSCLAFYIVIYICFDMNVHLLYDIHLIIGRMSYPVSDGVLWWWVWLKPCKCYRWCRLTLKSYRDDRLE